MFEPIAEGVAGEDKPRSESPAKEAPKRKRRSGWDTPVTKDDVALAAATVSTVSGGIAGTMDAASACFSLPAGLDFVILGIIWRPFLLDSLLVVRVSHSFYV